MIRSTLNLYLDGLMSLSQEREASGRFLLIEEALMNSSLAELLQDWIVLNGQDLGSALRVKLWFSLSYQEMAVIFVLSAKEMAQQIRNQRILRLPAYRPETTDIPLGSDISCFMVEQQMSAWVDCELEDGRTMAQLQRHFELCPLCRGRLELYRRLHSEILGERENFPPISIKEWDDAVEWLRRAKVRRYLHLGTVVTVILVAVVIMSWVLGSKPEKMPNVYEIQSQ
jgi:hypothetical protein